MNYDLGHPDFLGIYEQATSTTGIAGLGAGKEEEEKPGLFTVSSSPYETQASTDDPETYDWSGYDVGPDGIPGTWDDEGAPWDVDSLMDWFDNWYLPYANSGSAFMSALTGRNTISNMGGMMKAPMSQDSLWMRFFFGWSFQILYWDDWESFHETYGDMYPS